MFTKLVKHLSKVRLVLILIVAKNENLVQIHQNEIINVPMHNGVHESLEGTWCIAEPKWQNRVFKYSISHYKSSFLTCIQCKSNLVVTTGQVDCTQTHWGRLHLLIKAERLRIN